MPHYLYEIYNEIKRKDMSRDWKKWETYAADKHLQKQMGESLRGDIIWCDANGNEMETLPKPIREEARAKFPELTFLFYDYFLPIYNEHKDNDKVLAYFGELEDTLVLVEKAFFKEEDDGLVFNRRGDNIEIPDTEMGKAVRDWFLGNPKEHYEEDNNERFYSYILDNLPDEKIKEREETERE